MWQESLSLSLSLCVCVQERERERVSHSDVRAAYPFLHSAPVCYSFVGTVLSQRVLVDSACSEISIHAGGLLEPVSVPPPQKKSQLVISIHIINALKCMPF